MDFAWSKEQLAFKSAVIKFAQKELKDDLIERDRNSEVSRKNWQKCADFGILGLAVPEEYGGGATDILTAMLMMERYRLGHLRAADRLRRRHHGGGRRRHRTGG